MRLMTWRAISTSPSSQASAPVLVDNTTPKANGISVVALDDAAAAAPELAASLCNAAGPYIRPLLSST